MKIKLLLITFLLLLTATATAGEQGADGNQNEEERELEGVLIIKTIPEETAVSIRDLSPDAVVSSGKTPMKMELPSGSYKIRLSHEKYETGTTGVTIEPGKEIRLHIKLTPEVPGYHTLRILGHSLLWPGVATTITGVVLSAVDPNGTAGKVGFALIGVGLALDIAGAVCLGIAYKRKARSLQVSVVPLTDGAAVVYGRTF
ncbi:MAG: PEGA domain-containing protein [Proteobacteria bacterium]|nr:PEGA domain-containing protein [Pseudomonadota bacterium]